jgi:hypothetical protein
MKSVNRFIILTVIFNFLILVAAGHGIGFLGLFEFFGLTEFSVTKATFKFTGNFDDRLFTAALLALVGQITLTVAYFKKQEVQKFLVIYVGLCILLLSFFVLTIDLFNSTLDSFSFWGGAPFCLVSVILLIRTIKIIIVTDFQHYYLQIITTANSSKAFRFIPKPIRSCKTL